MNSASEEKSDKQDKKTLLFFLLELWKIAKIPVDLKTFLEKQKVAKATLPM